MAAVRRPLPLPFEKHPMKTNIDAVKAKVAKAQEQLEEKLAALQTSDDWKATLERMAILGATSINRYYAERLIMPHDG